MQTQIRPGAITTRHSGPPLEPRVPRRCIECKEEFKPGEPWVEVTDPDRAYAVGIHTAHLDQRDRETVAALEA
jgi:hypothetical protein